RLTKIRVVEKVKHFPTKFDQLVFSQLRALNHREVGVAKSWSNHYVTTKISKTSHRYHKRRNIKPAVRTAENRDWTCYVGPQRIVCACERGVMNDDVHRIASLQLHNRTELPTF